MFEGLFQPMHLLIILGLALLFFGPKRLPELGKGLGTSIRDFKDALSGSQKTDERADHQQAAATAPSRIASAPVNQPYMDTAPAAETRATAEAPRPPV
jgi:sec-independent protein translocase protein TatA